MSVGPKEATFFFLMGRGGGEKKKIKGEGCEIMGAARMQGEGGGGAQGYTRQWGGGEV